MLNWSSIYFGQKHPRFDYRDFDIIKKISRLARKHHRQCENDCNGEGYIRGQFYRCDSEKGYFDYKEGITVFTKETETIERKIVGLTVMNKSDFEKNRLHKTFSVDFQHDPRGCTVKLYYEDDFIEL